MYSSPGIPAGTGFSARSSTYARVLATGDPIGTVPPASAAGVSRAVHTPIVVSVGP